MPASEALYLGAPTLHIVAHEQHLRDKRRARDDRHRRQHVRRMYRDL